LFLLQTIQLMIFQKNLLSFFIKLVRLISFTTNYNKSDVNTFCEIINNNINTFHSHAFKMTSINMDDIFDSKNISSKKIPPQLLYEDVKNNVEDSNEDEDLTANDKEKKNEYKNDGIFLLKLQKHYRKLYLANDEFKQIVNHVDENLFNIFAKGGGGYVKGHRIISKGPNFLPMSSEFFNELRRSQTLMYRSFKNSDLNNEKYKHWKDYYKVKRNDTDVIETKQGQKQSINELKRNYLGKKIRNLYNVQVVDFQHSEKYYPSDMEITNALSQAFFEENPNLDWSQEVNHFVISDFDDHAIVHKRNFFFTSPTEQNEPIVLEENINGEDEVLWVSYRETCYETDFYTNQIPGYEQFNSTLLIPDLKDDEIDKRVIGIIEKNIKNQYDDSKN
jgi:hypothetical protein